jgi:hypothetical protein
VGFAVTDARRSLQSSSGLTRRAACPDPDEELLANAQKRYSDGGASLAAAGAARELDKTQKVRAKLATN